MSANGNIVNIRAKTWHDFTRQLGVAPLEYNDVYEVRDGKITVNLNITDQSSDLYALTMFNLDQDKDFVDLMMSTSGMPPSWADILLMEELEPGLSNTYTFTVENGPIYMICWSKPPDLPIGNAGPFVVIESS